MKSRVRSEGSLICLLFLLGGCAEAEEPPNETTLPQGALIQARVEGTVGVLLDELPDALKERAAAELIGESESFWVDRARAQVALAGYRLVFRDFFYEEAENKGQLPLPPTALWQFELRGVPSAVERDGHQLVLVDYEMTSTLLTAAASAAAADEALVPIGGTWEEAFVLPLDPATRSTAPCVSSCPAGTRTTKVTKRSTSRAVG